MSILSVLPKLKQMNKHLAEAAMDLGATPFYALRKVVIPEIMPGIITGALIAFTLSVDDFVISFFNTGKGVSNLSIEIFSMTRRGYKSCHKCIIHSYVCRLNDNVVNNI